MAEKIRWRGSPVNTSPRPRPTRRPKIEILKITNTDLITLCVCSRHVQSFWVHYDGRRTLPCTWDGHTCWADHTKYPPRWEGWLHVTKNLRSGNFMVRLPSGVLDQVPELDPAAKAVRGARLELRRKWAACTAPMIAVFTPEFYGETFIQHELSIAAEVERYYGAPLRHPERHPPAIIGPDALPDPSTMSEGNLSPL